MCLWQCMDTWLGWDWVHVDAICLMYTTWFKVCLGNLVCLSLRSIINNVCFFSHSSVGQTVTDQKTWVEECQTRGVTGPPAPSGHHGADSQVILPPRKWFINSILFQGVFVFNVEYPVDTADVWTYFYRRGCLVSPHHDVMTPRVMELVVVVLSVL